MTSDSPSSEDSNRKPAPADMAEAPAGTVIPGAPVMRGRRRRKAARASLIWLVPLIALIVTLALSWNAYLSRGPVVSVSFGDAAGITPGETTLKYREVTVGKVERLRFGHDLKRVIVDIRVEPSIAPYIDSSATFWVVRPQVTTSGISRLDTVLSGTFIEGDWTADNAGPRPDLFTGLDRPPLIRSSDQGTWLVLSASNGEGLSEGAPILFQGLEVGRMENLRLSPEDESVLADVFIDAPYDRRLTTATAFWDVSGFSASFGAQGLKLNVDSMASLIRGGASFMTFSSGGKPVQPGHVFRLYPDREAAEAGAPADDEQGQIRVSILLPDDLRGISQGTEVKLGGVGVGRVTGLSVTVPEDGADADHVMQDVTLTLSPSRLGLPEEADEESSLRWLNERVAAGLRARVASGGFLGMSLIIELLEDPDAPAASLDLEAEPHPRMPVIESDVQDIAGTAQGFLTRIGDLPIEETLRAAQDMMNSVTAITASEDTRAIPANLRRAIADIDDVVNEIKEITEGLNRNEVSAKLALAIDRTAEAMDSIQLAADEIPDMVDKIEATADDVREIDYAELGASIQVLSDTATGLVEDLRGMLGTDAAEELPRDLSETLKSASALLADLREGGAIGNLNALLESARVTVEDARGAMTGLPDLTDRARLLVARLDSVVASYGERSSFNTEMLTLMREMRRASSSIGSLARMIERNPRAFIMGR